ncbi:MAG: 30S ribosomal protein S6 [Bacteroidia bacterium]|jgi:small subunit ribosomal protein S6|nr:30S ribosomal protein S6 [Bacteroidia bacterium]
MAKTNYESVVVLTPVLSEKMMQEAVLSFEKLITENGGELIHKENWGLTKMAYPIQKKTTGFYQIFEFAAEPNAETVDKLELAYRRDEQVLRYLCIKLDKHAAKYNERRRNGEFNKPKVKETAAPEAAKPTSTSAPVAEAKSEPTPNEEE